jgi:hypothetical protein
VPFEVRANVGQVVAVRIRRLRRLEDVGTLRRMLHEAAREIATKIIFFADCRRAMPVPLFVPSAVADEWSRDMREFNERLARAGILFDRENETFNLQFERIVHCAGNPVRRVFYDPRELREWLSRALTATEMSLIDELLAVE